MFNKSLMCLLLLAALLFSGCIITGKVTDGNGKGIEGVTVTLTGAANLTTTTNSKGGYLFGNFFEVILGFTSDETLLIMPGSYTVTPSKMGYSFTPTNTEVSVTSECYGPLAADLPWPVGGVNFTAIDQNAKPVPGDWTGSPSFGGIEFIVNPSSTGISEITYIFSDFKCGGSTHNGTINARKQTGEDLCPINNKHFTLTSNFGPLFPSGLTMTISGTFDATGTHVSGSWEAVSYGTTCSGTWNGSAD